MKKCCPSLRRVCLAVSRQLGPSNSGQESSAAAVLACAIVPSEENTQPPFNPSVGSLCHFCATATLFSYRFPIFETSATALCGTTGMLTTSSHFWSIMILRNVIWDNLQQLRPLNPKTEIKSRSLVTKVAETCDEYRLRKREDDLRAFHGICSNMSLLGGERWISAGIHGYWMGQSWDNHGIIMG